MDVEDRDADEQGWRPRTEAFAGLTIEVYETVSWEGAPGTAHRSYVDAVSEKAIIEIFKRHPLNRDCEVQIEPNDLVDSVRANPDRYAALLALVKWEKSHGKG